MVQIVALTGALAYASKDRVTTVSLGDVVLTQLSKLGQKNNYEKLTISS